MRFDDRDEDEDADGENIVGAGGMWMRSAVVDWMREATGGASW